MPVFLRSIRPPEINKSSPTVKSAFVVSPVSATCVMFISWSSPKLITAPSARNRSENSSELVPSAAPSDASGTKAVVAVIVVA